MADQTTQAQQAPVISPDQILTNPISLTDQTLESVGLSAKIIGIATIAVIGILVYKFYFDLKKTKLDILKLQGELKLPTT